MSCTEREALCTTAWATKFCVMPSNADAVNSQSGPPIATGNAPSPGTRAVLVPGCLTRFRVSQGLCA